MTLITTSATSAIFTSTIGLRPIWSTKNTQGQPATLGKEAEEILNANSLIIEDVFNIQNAALHSINESKFPVQISAIILMDKTVNHQIGSVIVSDPDYDCAIFTVNSGVNYRIRGIKPTAIIFFSGAPSTDTFLGSFIGDDVKMTFNAPVNAKIAVFDYLKIPGSTSVQTYVNSAIQAGSFTALPLPIKDWIKLDTFYNGFDGSVGTSTALDSALIPRTFILNALSVTGKKPVSIVFYSGVPSKTTFISSVADLRDFDIPQNCVYIGINFEETATTIETYKDTYLTTIEANYIKSIPSPTIELVHSWGNSITAAGTYQQGIASELGITNDQVKNYGLASDYSQSIRRRFVEYYTLDTPYKGKATYIVPSLTVRQEELEKAFQVIWLGTNNLGCYNLDSADFPDWTINNPEFMALNPNPNFKIDRLYLRSYFDQMFLDIKAMIDLIPHNNWVIIGGHANFTVPPYNVPDNVRQTMIEFDAMMARMYPRNFIDLREIMLLNYNWLNTTLLADFVKPALNASVQFQLSDVSWLGNASGDICVGTKEIYDRYHVTAVSGNTVTATLIESKTELVTGEIMRANYPLTTLLGGSKVDMQMRVYSYEDCVHFGKLLYPRSCTDPIHFNSDWAIKLGTYIAKELQKIKR